MQNLTLSLQSTLKKYGNIGSGSTSYLSKTTCNEFIEIKAKEVFDSIISAIKTEQYFSISVDSTPDISHVDQLSFIIRYVSHDGHPIERFIGFIKNTGHKAEELFVAVTEMLKKMALIYKTVGANLMTMPLICQANIQVYKLELKKSTH